MRIIISMTTIPNRIKHLEDVLDSLINQNTVPDHIYINIPVHYNRFNSKILIPNFLYSDRYRHFVTIHYLKNDYGPATKFIGSLLNSNINSNDIIVVTDDDIIKNKYWLSKLLKCYSKNKICSFVEMNLGQEIVWGYLGYIFIKNLFNVKDLLNFFNNVKDKCYLVDDHWLTGYCHLRKILIYNIPINKNSEVNDNILPNIDSLVDMKNKNSRKNVSENCRNLIYQKYKIQFPFWCCIGCCNRKKQEFFTNYSKNSLNIGIIFPIILTIIFINNYTKNKYRKYLITVILSLIIYNLYINFLNYKIEYYQIYNSIPKIIIQTYQNKKKIPNKVYKNIKKYGENYKHLIYDDNDCINFLKKYFNPIIYKTFLKLKKGAHKADLFRYCFLYINGGIYLDIKTELIKSLDEIFNKPYVYTVLSIVDKTIYQGIIATPPKNPIFMELVEYIINNVNPAVYVDYTKDFYKKIKEEIHLVPKKGFNKNHENNRYNYYLFEEVCTKNPAFCYDGLDKYNICCYVYDNNRRIIKSRYADFPW